MTIIKKIKILERKRNRILNELLTFRPMIPGSFKEVYSRCGKDNCWCRHKAGHPHRRITWTENARSMTKAIPMEDVNWIKEVTGNYRKFRKKCKEIQKLQEAIKVLTSEYQKLIVKRTRKMRNYL